ncbi:glycosyltransferase [Flaviaesturariibacter aridisoli]|uniref:Glycosyltransferase n=1 Tax=Flaviaesturariibacter aridisoli TaxID=2545761 RepID=A0A4R4E117_9BACT|nr:glycosyltransferase [Flaviaesturariibacter aridisoli]TCZ73134.1 glycosyltransferase [Flaviaesturariibacter aridisoli]
MNILVLVQEFGQGGAEKVAAMVAQLLQERGRGRVFFYALNRGGSIPVIEGVECGSLDIVPRGGIKGKLGTYRERFGRLARLKKEKQIDLSISQLWPVDWISALTGNERKVAVMQINILNNDQNKAMVRMRPLVSYIYRKFNRIVLGSANLVPELEGFFRIPKEKLQVIYNPIDTALIDRNRAEPLPYRLEEVYAQHRVLVAAHRLAPIKNTESLFPIYKGLPKEANLKLLLIGEGEEKERLQRDAAAAGLRTTQCESADFDATADVYFLNFQRNIHNLIGRSAAFVFPTKGEGLPLGLLEALYSGAPALVSDCANGGVFEVLQGKGEWKPGRRSPEEASGSFLMPVPAEGDAESIQSWQQQLLAVVNADEATKARRAAQGRARAKDFDKESIRKDWYTLVDGVMG